MENDERTCQQEPRKRRYKNQRAKWYDARNADSHTFDPFPPHHPSALFPLPHPSPPQASTHHIHMSHLHKPNYTPLIHSLGTRRLLLVLSKSTTVLLFETRKEHANGWVSIYDSCGQLGNSELLNIEILKVLDSRIKNSTIADRLHVCRRCWLLPLIYLFCRYGFFALNNWIFVRRGLVRFLCIGLTCLLKCDFRFSILLFSRFDMSTLQHSVLYVDTVSSLRFTHSVFNMNHRDNVYSLTRTECCERF